MEVQVVLGVVVTFEVVVDFMVVDVTVLEVDVVGDEHSAMPRTPMQMPIGMHNVSRGSA